MSALDKPILGLTLCVAILGVVTLQKACSGTTTPPRVISKTPAHTPVNPAHLVVLENLLRELEADWIPSTATKTTHAASSAATQHPSAASTQEKNK